MKHLSLALESRAGIPLAAVLFCTQLFGQTPAPAAALDRTMVTALFAAEPAAPKAPAKTNEAAVELGAKLYFEKRLSHSSDVACATCHDLNNYGQDGKATSPGTGGAANRRSTLTAFNGARQFALCWDGRVETVEQKIMASLTSPSMHGLKDEAEVVSILKGIPEYADPFKKAFPRDSGPISAKNVGLALGAFARKLTTQSRFDKYLDGDDNALTAVEKQGLDTFIKTGCVACHTTRLVGGHMINKLGLTQPVETADKGRFEFTKKDDDKNMWRVPQLLNVEKTAPYLHDGSMATLEEVVEFMARVQLSKTMSKEETANVVAFLKALTGEPPKVVANLAKPAK